MPFEILLPAHRGSTLVKKATLTLLPELGLSLLHSRHHHVAAGSSRESVQPRAKTDDRDDLDDSPQIHHPQPSQPAPRPDGLA